MGRIWTVCEPAPPRTGGIRIPLAQRMCQTADEWGDWINEIHLNRNGLKKFSPRYAALVEQVLVAQGLPG